MKRLTLQRGCLAAAFVLGLAGCTETVPTKITQTLKGEGNVLSTTPMTLDLAAVPTTRTWGNAEDELISNRATGYGLVHLPAVEKYLSSLLVKIRTEAGVPNWPGQVYVLANSGLEAFTQSSGNIYISLGFLERLNTEDELVGLIAHEFAHSYLQYDALQSNLEGSDKFVDVTSALAVMGQGLASKGKAGTAKHSKDIEKATEKAAQFWMAYQLGRNMLAPAWSRTQENAADDMAVQLSIRLGYSVPDGLVRMLEHTLAHEQAQAKEKDILREAIEQSLTAVGERALNQVKDGNFSLAQLKEGAKSDLMGSGMELGGQVMELLRHTHPDTDKRIVRAQELHEKLIASREWPAARNQEWEKIKKTRAVQRTFVSYRNAAMATAALNNAGPEDARRFMRQSVVPETNNHALPAMAQWQVGGNNRAAVNALQANMRSPQHRAWRSYVVYADGLIGQGNRKEAAKVLNDGFQHFQAAPNAWMEYISMQMKMNNTEQAKTLAAQCAEKFSGGYASACKKAAEPKQTATALPGVGGGKNPIGWLVDVVTTR